MRMGWHGGRARSDVEQVEYHWHWSRLRALAGEACEVADSDRLHRVACSWLAFTRAFMSLHLANIIRRILNATTVGLL